MELFSWALMGLLVGFLAKVTFPAERDENVFLLTAVAVASAIAGGYSLQAIFRTGLLSMSGAGHAAAFVAAALVTVILRVATTPRLPAPRRR